MRTLALFLLAGLLSTSCLAGSYTAPPGQHFVAVASSKSRDEAIGIARLYGTARVVISQNGWYGVILGPTPLPSLAAFRKDYQGWPEIPPDAVWSTGNNYIDSEWLPESRLPEPVEFTAAAAGQMQSGKLTVTAKLNASADGQVAQITGWIGDAEQFDFSTPRDFYADYGNTLRLAPLDPSTPGPEAILTQNTGGAHCCVATWFASETEPGKWQLLDSDMLDGGGYWLEDIDGDGSFELMSVDNAFLYAFDSYAGSVAPLVVSHLRGEEIEPVDTDDAWRARKRQELAGLEFLAKLEPGNWKANGFLAGWVAVKIELGEGDAAWARMLKSYDRNSDFGPQICTSGEKVEDCPAENLKFIPFPEALAAFLKENGYTPVPVSR